MHPKESEALDVCKLNSRLLVDEEMLELIEGKYLKLDGRLRAASGKSPVPDIEEGREAGQRQGTPVLSHSSWGGQCMERQGNDGLNCQENWQMISCKMLIAVRQSKAEQIAVPQMLGGPLKASWSRGLAISREYERVKG
ncbi:hypothetical protein BD769DRAFT_1387349 [Suillus cothurnatus]|nr:hypothetical protein BD769DRAFT_1387349 [Suillus cothurnatus]